MIQFYSKKIFTFLFFLLITTSIYSQPALLKSKHQLNQEQKRQFSTSLFSIVEGKQVMSKLPLHPSLLKVQSPTDLEVTKVLDQNWVSGAWENDTQVLYGFNSSGQQSLTTYQYWNAGAWENQYKYEYTYQALGGYDSYTSYEWKSGAWEPSMRYTYTYNGEGRTVSYLGQQWTSGAWQDYIRYTYSYNASGYTASVFGELYDSGSWVNYYKTTNTYDSNNNEIEYVSQYWNEGAWQNSYRSTYEYDSQGNEIAYNSYTWMGTAWMNMSRYTYSYNSNGRTTEEIYYTWLNYVGPWTAVSKSMYTYNANGYTDIITDQSWTDPGPWINDSQSAYTYQDGNTQKILYSKWNGSGWENDSQTLYTYTDIVDVNNHNTIPANFSLSQNYPNPFNPSTVINYELPRESFVSLKVYDMLGREVSALVNEVKNAGSYQIQFNAKELGSGIYFYKLIAGEFSKTVKMMILK